MNKTYLAARYGKRLELCGYREELEAMGYEITSRWLNGKHQIDNVGKPIGDKGESLIEGDAACATSGANSPEAQALRQSFAVEDVNDVLAVDILVNFTEPPRTTATRGGRHVEFGIGIATGKRLIVVGHRENIFHWLPKVEFFATWAEAREFLKGELGLLKPKLEDK